MVSRSIVVAVVGHRLQGLPVTAQVDAPSGCRAVELVDSSTGASVAAQLEVRSDGASITWIEHDLEEGGSKTYDVRFLTQPAVVEDSEGVHLKTEADCRLDILVRSKFFTAYYYGPQWYRPYFHPVIGPYGDAVTRGYPMIENVPGETTDHVHHRGIWTAYGDVSGVDNWSEVETSGRTLHRKFAVVEGGRVFGRAVALSDWVAPDGRRVLLRERREIKVYDTSPSPLVDVDLTLTAAEGAVVFRDTKEAGFISLRVASPMDVPRGGRLQNSLGGVNESEVWGKRALWCDYSGTVAGRRVGVALFDHRSNIGHPTYWHARDYGLVAANPFGLSIFEGKGHNGDYSLPAGESLRLRYRIYIHEGDAGRGVAEMYAGYVEPPSVEVS